MCCIIKKQKLFTFGRARIEVYLCDPDELMLKNRLKTSTIQKQLFCPARQFLFDHSCGGGAHCGFEVQSNDLCVDLDSSFSFGDGSIVLSCDGRSGG